MELTDYRDRFPILRHTTYLINHSLGAMPAAVEERLAEYARSWRERGIRAWSEGWWTMPMTVGDQIGRIIGAPLGSTVMHQNVAVAEAIVVSCFRPVEPHRNRVVYEEGNFPSVRYLYQAQPELEVVVVPNDGAIVEAIDERTLLVPMTHVLFKTGEIQDVAAIVERAHAAGAHVILDAYQSAGIVPLDVTGLNVDFAVGGSVTVRVPEFEAVHRELAERQILCDFRPEVGLRLGPHYYNEDDELRFAVEQVREIVESAAYERHRGAVARF